MLSSVAIAYGEELSPNLTGNTMPGRFFIQRFLRQAVEARCEYAVVEVTSQGIEQSRHRFIRWWAAAFLNLHPEHIEAHGSFEKYREAKVNFFRYVFRTNREAHFFVNREDESSGYFEEVVAGQDTHRYAADDIQFELSPYLAGINKPNAALAAEIAKAAGMSAEEIIVGMRSFTGVPGRMEIVQREPFAVVIDYAYTPESARLAYREIKALTGVGGKIITVFGSAGGGRDKWKRPELGRIADEHCGKIILTTEEPYNEKPEDIMEDIAKGVANKEKVEMIVDRREAIKKAVAEAREGDVVALMGKGAEPYIHLGKKKMPWNERQITEEIMAEIKNSRGAGE